MTTELRTARVRRLAAPALHRMARLPRGGLRAPVTPLTTFVSLTGTLLLAGVWAWPVEEAPMQLDTGVVRVPTAPQFIEENGVTFTPDGLLAGVVLVPNGAAIPVLGVRPDDLRDTFGRPRGEERRHSGIDIGAPRRTPVAAALDGWIYSISNGPTGGLGLHMIDRTGHWLLYYAHLDGHAPGLYRGQAVRRGELLGYVGATGNAHGFPHLHFEVGRLSKPGQINARAVNPFDFLQGRVSL